MYLKANAPEAALAGKTVIGFNLINGREVEGDLAMIQVRSAVDRRDLVGIFPESGEKDVARAAKAAAEAFQDWSRTSLAARRQVLTLSADLLERHQEKLARILIREVGLTASEALAEVRVVLSICRTLAAETDQPRGADAPSSRPQQPLQSHRRPLGVFAVLAAGASPLAAPMAALLPALLAGNTIVWKPSSLAPTAAYLLVRTLQEAGLPPGVINTLNGRGRAATGRHFLGGLQKGLFQGFAFTGSEAVARTAGELAGHSLVHTSLNLGATNAMIVMPDADLAQVVRDALQGAYRRAGQCGTHLGNLLVHEACLGEVRQGLLEGLAALKVGNPLTQSEVAFGPMAHARLAETLKAHWAARDTDGSELLWGGSSWTEENRGDQVLGEIGYGAYLQPTLWGGVTPDCPLFNTEAFGPSLNLCSVRSFEEALAWANATRTGRTCSLYSHNGAWAKAFRQASRAGITGLNALPQPTDPWLLRELGSPEEVASHSAWQWRHSLAAPAPAAGVHAAKPLPPTDWDGL